MTLTEIMSGEAGGVLDAAGLYALQSTLTREISSQYCVHVTYSGISTLSVHYIHNSSNEKSSIYYLSNSNQ
ncbi:hypothetical protein I7I50_01469 [Histoplasma capsulatum G186AR]|uniref:Uncharacterized protein n=1 Tax=Ajellomyces capsulatus TaxID=5037 RepID=A0A8H7YCX1_AJECA|nr:hypothetical protein I7I52_12585 [Histoplasma capsulatum]QSS73341.1 hypothetical protein I7I50_01469 [Histoplasma capsulatum G186AR]